MGEKEIYQWLHRAREAGLSDMKIVEKLKNQGWSNADIDKILVGAYSAKPDTPPPPKPKKEKIFSPAEKFQKERGKQKDPLEQHMGNLKFSGNIGRGSFGIMLSKMKKNWKSILGIYLLITVSLGGIVLTPEKWPFISLLFTVITSLIFFLSIIMISRDQWSIKNAFQDIFPLYFKYIYTMILAFLAVIGGTVLLMVPGILLSISLTLLPYVVINEEKYGLAAIIRANDLAKGHRGSIFMYSLLFQFLIGLVFGIIIIVMVITLTSIGLNDNNILSHISIYSISLFVSLIYSLGVVASLIFYKSFYDELSYFKPPNDLIRYEATSKNGKFYISTLVILGFLASTLYIYAIFTGTGGLNNNNIIGTQKLINEDIEFSKMPFTYSPPSGFINSFNNQYRNGYSSTFSYAIPNNTDKININIYLEENDNDLTALEYMELDENIFDSIGLYEDSTILSKGEFKIDSTTGYSIEKTYEFFGDKKYLTKIVYTKKDYITEISLECDSFYSLDYKKDFVDSLDSFRVK